MFKRSQWHGYIISNGPVCQYIMSVSKVPKNVLYGLNSVKSTLIATLIFHLLI